MVFTLVCKFPAHLPIQLQEISRIEAQRPQMKSSVHSSSSRQRRRLGAESPGRPLGPELVRWSGAIRHDHFLAENDDHDQP